MREIVSYECGMDYGRFANNPAGLSVELSATKILFFYYVIVPNTNGTQVQINKCKTILSISYGQAIVNGKC